MTLSTKQANTAMEAIKPQASSPNFVLTMLAACSNSVPAAGQEGEVTLREQMSALLQDKAMTVEELNLLYNYKFGLSINDALKFVGFDGKVQEFLDEEKCFSIHEGCVSLKPIAVTIEDETPAAPKDPILLPAKIKPPANDEVAAPEDCALALALDFTEKNIEDDGTASDADTESTTDAESSQYDADSEIDITGWYSIGGRLAAALGSSEDNVDEVRWKMLGGRVAAALNTNDNEDGEDVGAWCDVGIRIAKACKLSDDDECDQDLSPDAAEWHSVGARILRSFDALESGAE